MRVTSLVVSRLKLLFISCRFPKLSRHPFVVHNSQILLSSLMSHWQLKIDLILLWNPSRNGGRRAREGGREQQMH